MGKTLSLSVKEISNSDVGLSLIMNQKLPITPSWRFGQWKENTERVNKLANKKREEIIKELGVTKDDGSVEVLPENKQKYFSEFKTLMEQKADIEIPEIQVSLLKDVPLSVRFTTLVGHYLNNDLVKLDLEKYENLTNQQIIDLDLATSLIMNDLMPVGLAIKLGEAKRKAETVSNELRELRDELIKKYGVLNKDFDYEITDPAKRKISEDEIQKWLDQTAKPIDLPTFYINEFETSITIDDEKKELQYPLRFFTLLSPFVKEQDEKKEKEEEKKKSNKKAKA